MAVVELDIYLGDDPNAVSPLVTLTDEDIESFEMRVGENELGAGQFTIRRDHPDATEANLASGNYVKVRLTSLGVAWAFWIDEHDDTLIASDEESGETLTRGGPGPLAILGRAMLLNTNYATSPPASAFRGSLNEVGKWTWTNEPYGAILTRLIEEGQDQPGTPLVDVTIDFDRTDDTDSVLWPNITATFEADIGTDGLSVYSSLVASGQLYVRPTPDLLIHAYTTRGVDRTSLTYATGKVRFVKGENVLTEVKRAGSGTKAATHVLVQGKDNVYRQLVDPAYVSGPGRWRKVDYNQTDDLDLLDAVGDQELVRRNADLDTLELEFRAGNDASVGRYLPFTHFKTGDLVTLHTGTAEWDYDNVDARVTGFRIVLGEASDDATTELAYASLRWIVELNGGPTSGELGRPGATAVTSCCPCTNGTAIPETDPIAYFGEYYGVVDMGTHTSGVSATYSFGFPYIAGTLTVFLDGVMVVPTSTDPDAGEFVLGTGFATGDVYASCRAACQDVEPPV